MLFATHHCQPSLITQARVLGMGTCTGTYGHGPLHSFAYMVFVFQDIEHTCPDTIPARARAQRPCTDFVPCYMVCECPLLVTGFSLELFIQTLLLLITHNSDASVSVTSMQKYALARARAMAWAQHPCFQLRMRCVDAVC